MHQIAPIGVHSLAQRRAGGNGAVQAQLGQQAYVGEGGVGQGEGRGVGHRRRHIGHAVVQHLVHPVDRVAEGCGVGRFDAAALVDGDIHDHRSRLHVRHHLPGHQSWRRGAGDQHRADHQVGPAHGLGDGPHVRGQGYQPALEQVVQLAQAVQVPVDHGHPRPSPDGDPGGIGPDYTAPQDHHLSRGHARHPAQQHPAAPVFLLQVMRPDLDRHPAGHLAHRSQQGQRAVGLADRLVGHGVNAGLQKFPGQLG